MPFYEIIYETGSHSLSFADSDEQVVEAVTEQHRRATAGEVGGPSGHPAERVVKVLKYDRHPADYNESQLMDVKDISKLFGDAVENKSLGGQVSVTELAAVVRDMASPIVDSAPHESNYKMKEVGQLSNTWKDA